MEDTEVPDDYASFAVQAALFVEATSESVDLPAIVHELLLSKGCEQEGDARLSDGTPLMYSCSRSSKAAIQQAERK